MFELLEHYGLTFALVMFIFFSTLSCVRALTERWRATMPPRQYIWATRPKPKQKRKRTLNAPEKRYYEALKAIADREQRPRMMEKGETPSDIAQARDLAYTIYLHECAERRAAYNARPVAILQMPDDATDFYEHYSDFMTGVKKESQG